ncbi:MAG TPA: class I adenylate-forming enzyme family protein [Stellaceae bacterium]|nr:class I adenylate-forming enzyme family protein [Stellaceae bacterium]
MRTNREQEQKRSFWRAIGPGGVVRREQHYGDRDFLCFGERWPDLGTMVREVVATHGDSEAVVGDGRRLTYRSLSALAENAAGQLARRGIKAGDRVALLLGNCPEFLIFFLACIRLGAIAVPLDIRQREPELRYLLDDCGAVALVLETELSGNLPPPDATLALTLRIGVGGVAPGCEPVADFLAPASAPPMPTVREEDTAVILYTSGTTGRPKGAMLTHLGIIHSLITLRRCLELVPGERAILAVPASHVTGLVAVLLAMVSLGGATILMRAFKASEFLALAAAERLTYTVLVPAQYMLCLREPAFSRVDLGRWRIGAFGGAPMSEAAISELAERLPGLTLVNAYGATETTSPTTLMPPGENAAHLDSIGQVVPCGEVRVVDAEGRDVPSGEAGELWIKGPMVVQGYWGKPEATAANFTDGYWRSGDIGSIDAEGFVRIHDRLKDMINRAGYKIYSAEVENVLAYHEGVLECAVVGRPDPVLGEGVHAFVRRRDGGVTAEALRAFCAERMADYKVPETIELTNEPLPRNANGKVQKAVLRERTRAGPTSGL